MAKSDTTQDLELAGAAVAGTVPRISGMQRMRGRLGQCAAGISTCALGLTVTAMAAAQSGKTFKVAPKSAEAEAAAEASDMILGVPVNTIFFVAVGVIAVLWFTLGGGRKPKVTRR